MWVNVLEVDGPMVQTSLGCDGTVIGNFSLGRLIWDQG